MRRLFIILILATTSPAMASDYQVISQVATVIASAEPCGFKIDEDAIADYFSKNVAADDLAFAGKLNTALYAANSRLKNMPGLQKRIHCAQTRRAAKAHGFIN